jgi:hypothetical protein
MKKFNLKKIIKGLFLTLPTLIAITTFADDGVSTGNGTDSILPYQGFKAKAKLSAARVAPQVERNFNIVESQGQIIKSTKLGQTEIHRFDPDDLLRLYIFSSDADDLADLYTKAVNKQGDFTSLENLNNPFAVYLKNSKGNKSDVASVIKTDRDAFYPIESLNALVNGLSLKAKVRVNSKMQDHSCQVCNWTDYKAIPEGGIDFEVACDITSIQDAISYRSNYTPDDTIFYTGVKAHIASQMDQFEVFTPVMTGDMAEYIRVKYCNDPSTPEINVELSCYLKPASESDSRKLKASFNASIIPLGNTDITLTNLNVENPKSIFAPNYKVTRSLDADKDYSGGYTYWYSGGKGIKLLPTIETTVGYNFERNYSSDISIYGRSEADLAEFVRKSFIESYELSKKRGDF